MRFLLSRNRYFRHPGLLKPILSATHESPYDQQSIFQKSLALAQPINSPSTSFPTGFQAFQRLVSWAKMLNLLQPENGTLQLAPMGQFWLKIAPIDAQTDLAFSPFERFFLLFLMFETDGDFLLPFLQRLSHHNAEGIELGKELAELGWETMQSLSSEPTCSPQQHSFIEKFNTKIQRSQKEQDRDFSAQYPEISSRIFPLESLGVLKISKEDSAKRGVYLTDLGRRIADIAEKHHSDVEIFLFESWGSIYFSTLQEAQIQQTNDLDVIAGLCEKGRRLLIPSDEGSYPLEMLFLAGSSEGFYQTQPMWFRWDDAKEALFGQEDIILIPGQESKKHIKFKTRQPTPSKTTARVTIETKAAAKKTSTKNTQNSHEHETSPPSIPPEVPTANNQLTPPFHWRFFKSDHTSRTWRYLIDAWSEYLREENNDFFTQDPGLGWTFLTKIIQNLAELSKEKREILVSKWKDSRWGTGPWGELLEYADFVQSFGPWEHFIFTKFPTFRPGNSSEIPRLLAHLSLFQLETQDWSMLDSLVTQFETHLNDTSKNKELKKRETIVQATLSESLVGLHTTREELYSILFGIINSSHEAEFFERCNHALQELKSRTKSHLSPYEIRFEFSISNPYRELPYELPLAKGIGVRFERIPTEPNSTAEPSTSRYDAASIFADEANIQHQTQLAADLGNSQAQNQPESTRYRVAIVGIQARYPDLAKQLAGYQLHLAFSKLQGNVDPTDLQLTSCLSPNKANPGTTAQDQTPIPKYKPVQKDLYLFGYHPPRFPTENSPPPQDPIFQDKLEAYGHHLAQASALENRQNSITHPQNLHSLTELLFPYWFPLELDSHKPSELVPWISKLLAWDSLRRLPGTLLHQSLLALWQFSSIRPSKQNGDRWNDLNDLDDFLQELWNHQKLPGIPVLSQQSAESVIELLRQRPSHILPTKIFLERLAVRSDFATQLSDWLYHPYPFLHGKLLGLCDGLQNPKKLRELLERRELRIERTLMTLYELRNQAVHQAKLFWAEEAIAYIWPIRLLGRYTRTLEEAIRREISLRPHLSLNQLKTYVEHRYDQYIEFLSNENQNPSEPVWEALFRGAHDSEPF